MMESTATNRTQENARGRDVVAETRGTWDGGAGERVAGSEGT